MFGYPAFVEIIVVSVALGFVTSLVYRLMTDPKKMKAIRDASKEYNEKMKKAQKSGNTKEQQRLMKESLSNSNKLMSMSMKPMMITLLLFFGVWMVYMVPNYGSININFANGQGTFVYDDNEYQASYEKTETGFNLGIDFDKNGEIAQGEIFAQSSIVNIEGTNWQIEPVLEGFLFFQSVKENATMLDMKVAKLPFETSMPFMGNYMNLFWLYLFTMFPASMIFRKLLGAE